MLSTEQKLLLSATSLSVIPIFAPRAIEILLSAMSRVNLRHQDGITIGKAIITDEARLRHTHMVGATGSGKTVLLERLLFEDLKRGRGAIIIDPKGEVDFYLRVKAFVESIGRSSDLFLLSANQPGSISWNPCELGNPSELQSKFLNSSVYNEPHYAKACEYVLLKAFDKLRNIKRPLTLFNLIETLKLLAEKEKKDIFSGLFYDLYNLNQSEWGSIFEAPNQRPSKSIKEIIENGQILFVDLPTEGKRVQSGRIGRLITQEIILISGKIKRSEVKRPEKPFSVFVDEFDAFATESFSTFLNKGRSSGFMIHLSHQTLSDLDLISKSFSGQILGNCAVRFIFRQDDPDDAERWSRFIGTKTITRSTYRTQNGSKTGESSNREAQEFRVSPDQIKSLPVGSCIYSNKVTHESFKLKIPFKTQLKASIKPLPIKTTIQTLDPLPKTLESKWDLLFPIQTNQMKRNTP